MMRTRIFSFLPQVMKCYFLVFGILMLIIGCGVIWLFWRSQGQLLSYAASPHRTIKAIPIPVPKRTLSAQELAFGEEQVETMVRDRPEMNRYVHKGDPIWNFCARQFGGEAIGTGIFWNSSEPDHANSDYQSPHQEERGDIHVRGYDSRRRQKNSCEELWSYAVFELCNIRTGKQQNESWDAALSGHITRQEWIRHTAQLEYQALPYLASIYITLWKPSMEAKGIKTSPSLWRINAPGTFEEWIALYTDPNDYPWNYGNEYDNAIMPILRQHAKDSGCDQDG